MKLSRMWNLLPRELHLFGCGTRTHKLIQKVIGKVVKCPNCGSSKFQKNRLRCYRKGHWFCLNCSVAHRTAVDCPVCYKKYSDAFGVKKIK